MEVEEIVSSSGGVARPGPDVAGALASLRADARTGPRADLRLALPRRRGAEAGRIAPHVVRCAASAGVRLALILQGGWMPRVARPDAGALAG
jgi:hypothetical protein